MLKKISLFFAMCALLALSANKMSAQIAQGTTGNLTWVLTNDSVLTISGNDTMPNYSYNSFPWYANRNEIKSAVIGDSVTTIGNSAFYSCSSLISVTIPHSVTIIGNGAFYDCTSLTSVTIPDSVATIGNDAFAFCSGLTSVTISDSVTTIGNFAFVGCSSLTSITIPNSVTTIGNNAFAYCSSLISVTIPNSVTTIGDFAFASCSSLTFVTIGDSVTTIRYAAFSNCSSLTSVTIPNSVTTIGGYPFVGCSSLTVIDVAADNPNYSSDNGVLLNKNQTILMQCPARKSGVYSIPNSVTIIEDVAFYYCSSLISVTIPNAVTTIGSSAFYGCSSLAVIYVDAVTPPQIGSNAFLYVPTTIPVHVPCGKASDYQSAQYWNDFTNIIDDIAPAISVQSNDMIMGTAVVTQVNTCTNDQAVIEATPNAGYRFVQWNDGITDNRRTITVTQDTTFVAEFEAVDNSIVETNGNASVQLFPNPVSNGQFTISNGEGKVEIYTMQGVRVDSYSLTDKETIINVSHLANGVYLVKAGNTTRKLIVGK
jgi:hypothetical protein